LILPLWYARSIKTTLGGRGASLSWSDRAVLGEMTANRIDISTIMIATLIKEPTLNSLLLISKIMHGSCILS